MCGDGIIDKFPQLDNCCFCCQVETGSKVIAWLSAIGKFVLTIVMLIALVVAAGSTNSGDEAKDAEAVGIVIGASITLVLLLLYLIIDILLLIGLYKEDMVKVKAWLRVSIFSFFIGLVGAVLKLINTVGSPAHSPEETYQIIFVIIQVLFTLYMISVVKSHYNNKTEGFKNLRTQANDNM